MRPDKLKRRLEAQIDERRYHCRHCGEIVEPVVVGNGSAFSLAVAGRCKCPEAMAERLDELGEHGLDDGASQSVADSRLSRAGLAGRYAGMTFDTFDSSLQPQAYEAAKSFDGDKSLVLQGAVGVGKTHLACADLRHAVEVLELRGSIQHVPNLLVRLRASYWKNAAIREGQILRELVACDLLVLDDLGTEKTTKWTRGVHDWLIDRFYVLEKNLIITTNLGAGALDQAIGPRCASRLVEMAQWVEMEGPDYRVRASPPKTAGNLPAAETGA